jgi:hypothetical protein
MIYAIFMGEKDATTISSKVYKFKKNCILILDNSPVEKTKWRIEIFWFFSSVENRKFLCTPTEQ